MKMLPYIFGSLKLEARHLDAKVKEHKFHSVPGNTKKQLTFLFQSNLPVIPSAELLVG